MTDAGYSYALKPTEHRGAERIAWRFWPVSPKHVSAPLYADVVAFNLHRQIAAIGYGDFPLHEEPADREAFAAGSGWNRAQRDIAFQFTCQMRRGDIILICESTKYVLAWGLLLDDMPLFFVEDDPMWSELGPLRQRVWDEDQGEQFCNYRRVDRWRPFNSEPLNEAGRLPGAPQPTVMPYKEADIIEWLAISENLPETRRNLSPAATDPERFRLSPVTTRRNGGKRGRGRMIDKHRRQAVEWHAMELAQRYYERKGYAVEDTSANKPYDLLCEKGEDVRLVEVKGTTLTAASVDLTANEVESAREFVTDLFVVSDIECTGHGEDARAIGGNCRVFKDWDPKNDDLEPTAYRYSVPNGGKVVRVPEPDTEGEEE